MNTQRGFTLIELVMVIVILGILAATALPKFADLTFDAEGAAVSGARAAVSSASAIIHAQALVDNIATSASGDAVTVEGVSVDLVYGYPEAEDIAAAAGLDVNDFTITATSATVATISHTRANCNFTYTEASSATVPAAVSAVGAGC